MGRPIGVISMTIARISAWSARSDLEHRSRMRSESLYGATPSVSGVVFRMIRREGFAVLGEGPRSAGNQDEEVVVTYGVDERACVEFATHSARVSCAPRVEGTCPRLDGLGFEGQLTALLDMGADGW